MIDYPTPYSAMRSRTRRFRPVVTFWRTSPGLAACVVRLPIRLTRLRSVTYRISGRNCAAPKDTPNRAHHRLTLLIPAMSASAGMP